MVSDRAQLHTLEGVTASIVIVLAIVYVFNAFAVVPNASSTTSQAAENQMQGLADDVLTQAASNGNLKEAMLNWSNRRFNETESSYYYTGRNPPGRFGNTLENVLWDEGYNYNIELVFSRPDGGEGTLTLVRNGEPNNNAVSASRQIVLNDDDRLHGDGPTLEDSNSYPIQDIADDPTIRLYNVVRVRMTVWR